VTIGAKDCARSLLADTTINQKSHPDNQQVGDKSVRAVMGTFPNQEYKETKKKKTKLIIDLVVAQDLMPKTVMEQ
jgi:hypothetical protein